MEAHDPHSGGTVKVPQEAQDMETVITFAKMVRNDLHFRQILRTTKPWMRKQVYDLIKPHLLFTPSPYGTLMGPIRKEENAKKET